MHHTAASEKSFLAHTPKTLQNTNTRVDCKQPFYMCLCFGVRAVFIKYEYMTLYTIIMSKGLFKKVIHITYTSRTRLQRTCSDTSTTMACNRQFYLANVRPYPEGMSTVQMNVWKVRQISRIKIRK